MTKAPSIIQLTKNASIDLTSSSFKSDGLRIWCTGESGAGKSNTNMLIASQWLEAGNQLIVLDSHGEFGNLWPLRPGKVKRIGYGEPPVKEESVDWVVGMMREGLSVLIDLSHWTDIDPQPLDRFIGKLMPELYRFAREKPAHRLILLEEAHGFAPQKQSPGQYENIKLFISMLTGGRKFGLHFLLSSQRGSLIEADVIAQCNVRIFHRVSELADWKRIKANLPSKFPVDFGSKTKRDIRLFESGEAVIVSRWFETQRGRLNRPTVEVTKFLEEGDAA